MRQLGNAPRQHRLGRPVEAWGLGLRIEARRSMDDLLRLAEDPDAWAALATLIVMEVVLGLDNLVFIALLTNRVDERRRGLARKLGLSLALVFRLALLASASWLVRLTEPLATVYGRSFSIRDLLLLAGGLFLVWKATTEIHHRVDRDAEAEDKEPAPPLGLIAGLIQIIMIDIVFSVDSIITAVGMTEYFPIMVVAVVVAVAVMMVAVGPLATFINRNPTVLMLALSFLLMIGMTLIADGFGFHIERGYIYAAMFFSSLVEALNVLARRKPRRRT
jgi:predicted tellurium resistance membrane protein TerC